MKKILSLALCALILISGAISSPSFAQNKDTASANIDQPIKSQAIAIVPLDSRPCNTQYPQLIGGIMNQNILLPPIEILDNFTSPSNENSLWEWMEEIAPSTSKMIIYTNQLLNGGLISSRSYTTVSLVNSQTQKLVNFIEKHPELEITIVSILPRLLPNQYDITFNGYSQALTKWGEQADYNSLLGLPGPNYPSAVPSWVANKYKSVFEYHYLLVDSLSELANQGKISELVIGQDDGEKFAPSNIIFRKMQQKGYQNVSMQKGADEITMMILASYEAPKDLEVNVVYTNPEKASEYLPYESAPLNNIVSEKLKFFGITENPLAKDKIIIHNDPLRSSSVSTYIPLAKTGFVGVADVAYTNRGDTELQSLLFSKNSLTNIDSYSGWNTATNSVGTVLSQYVATKVLEDKLEILFPEETSLAIESLLKFKYLRLNEDIIYQGLMYTSMGNVYRARNMINSSGEFVNQSASNAENLLNNYSLKYRAQLDSVFQGRNFVYVGEKLFETSYKIVNSIYSFPWNRTFEIKAFPLFIKQ